MRIVGALLLLLLLNGCAHEGQPVNASTSSGPARSKATQPTAQQPSGPRSNPVKSGTAIVTPDVSVVGKVLRYNTGGRFVVVQFPIISMPQVGTRVFLYRDGLKVGEVKITGPQKGEHTVGDLMMGDAQAGDLVRDR